MKLLMVVLIALGLIAVAALVVANLSSVEADEPKQISCSTCGNSCSADSNCGLESCGAVQGGSCGCGK